MSENGSVKQSGVSKVVPRKWTHRPGFLGTTSLTQPKTLPVN
jgi:hypothetical protein